MDGLQNSVKKDLIKVYLDFIDNPEDKKTKLKACELDRQLVPIVNSLLDKKFTKAIWNLMSIYSGELSIKEAKVILEGLNQ